MHSASSRAGMTTAIIPSTSAVGGTMADDRFTLQNLPWAVSRYIQMDKQSSPQMRAKECIPVQFSWSG